MVEHSPQILASEEKATQTTGLHIFCFAFVSSFHSFLFAVSPVMVVCLPLIEFCCCLFLVTSSPQFSLFSFCYWQQKSLGRNCNRDDTNTNSKVIIRFRQRRTETTESQKKIVTSSLTSGKLSSRPSLFRFQLH